MTTGADTEPGFADALVLGRTPPDAPPVSHQPVPAPPTALLTGRGRHLDDRALVVLLTQIITGRAREDDLLPDTLFARFGSLAGLLSASTRELEGVKDMGAHMLPMIRVLHECALRYNHARLPPQDVLGSEQQLLDYLTARLSRENIEQFRILFLDDKQSLMADEAQARGTVNHTPVYPREVARRAMEIGATSLVLVHNHPSGDPTPSEADIQMTRQVGAALDVVGVTLADHLIIGNGCHTSFLKSGLL